MARSVQWKFFIDNFTYSNFGSILEHIFQISLIFGLGPKVGAKFRFGLSFNLGIERFAMAPFDEVPPGLYIT